ncbi:MAG: TetR/AcrR family transcriptional regulator, partial [Bacteroidales bacterium]|nr:TetR/AcrR family transcriptional regulator [Bacteroidales bacterium]
MDNRLRILKDVAMMFKDSGIRSVTMEHISTELGISKRTLYEIFSDKDDLVKQVIEEGVKAHKEFCTKAIETSENVIEAIFKIGQLNVEMYHKINPIFFDDLRKFHSNIFKKIQEKDGIKDISITKSLFEIGIKDGLFSSDLNIEIVNIFIHKVFDFIYEDELKVFQNQDLTNSILLPYF